MTGTSLGAFESTGGPNIGTIDVTADCDLPQPQISWTATGVAAGTYSGPYTETGTATLAQPLLPSTFTFTAAFTIDSPIGFVSGTKGVSVPGGLALCQDAVAGRVVSIDQPNVPYTATITTAAGTCTTAGTSTIKILDQFSLLEGSASTLFTETFDTGTVPACTSTCPPDGDEDRDGLNDSRESIFGTLLSQADSDRDGTVDGNDDANGNGEDDEDEDDDEDDGCPDEDGDGDGDDDEDEDDDDHDD